MDLTFLDHIIVIVVFLITMLAIAIIEHARSRMKLMRPSYRDLQRRLKQAKKESAVLKQHAQTLVDSYKIKMMRLEQEVFDLEQYARALEEEADALDFRNAQLLGTVQRIQPDDEPPSNPDGWPEDTH